MTTPLTRLERADLAKTLEAQISRYRGDRGESPILALLLLNLDAALDCVRKLEAQAVHKTRGPNAPRAFRTGAKDHAKPKMTLNQCYEALGRIPEVGGWLPVTKVWQDDVGKTFAEVGGFGFMSARVLPTTLAIAAGSARWLRLEPDGTVAALLVPNGTSRSSARQISVDGSEIIVPLPALAPTATIAQPNLACAE